MATKSATVTSVEFVPANGTTVQQDSWVITTDVINPATKQPQTHWVTNKFMDNWLVRNTLFGFDANIAMLGGVVSWSENSVKAGEPVLNRKGEPVLDANNNPRVYTKDHVRTDALTVGVSPFVRKMQIKESVKQSVKAKFSGTSLSAMFASPAKTGGSRAPQNVEIIDDGLELSPEEQAEMAAEALKVQ